jgi:hypothetical protein
LRKGMYLYHRTSRKMRERVNVRFPQTSAPSNAQNRGPCILIATNL